MLSLNPKQDFNLSRFDVGDIQKKKKRIVKKLKDPNIFLFKLENHSFTSKVKNEFTPQASAMGNVIN